MNRTMNRSLRRLLRTRARGQSIPLIALMVVLLFGMVGLSVDVGNTFAEERKAVAASNAASLSGMDAYIKGGTGVTNEVVYNAIVSSLESNDIDLGEANGQLQLEARYLNADGERIGPDVITNSSDQAPDNVSYIEVNLEGKIDTFFARIAGREDLPLGSQSYAGRCPPTSGVYPLAINNAYIDGNNFADPGITDPNAEAEFGIMTSREFRNYTWRRVYLGDGATQPGALYFLRWLETSGAGALKTSLSGDGNLDEGFQEVPQWPGGGLPEPDVYPERPNQLNIGDWLYGAAGSMSSVESILEQHRSSKTYMILPITDVALGSGNDAMYRVVRLGAFVVNAIGSTPGRGDYVDLVFLGDPEGQGTACAVTAVTPADDSYVLSGFVDIWPEYEFYPDTRQPVQFMVVLDVSGSMSANFNGQCNNSGGVKQCTNGPPGAPQATGSAGAGSGYWNPKEERRIYVAKNAMMRLIDLMNLPGNASYDPRFPQDEMALVWFNNEQKTSMTFNWSSNATSLKNAVKNAHKQGSDIYLTSGGTNGAGGLYRGSLILKQRPGTTVYNNQRWEYKRVVIYLSDGVSNQFLDTSKSNLHGGSSDSGTYPNGSACRALGGGVIENAACQTTDVGGIYTAKNWDRPITQMVNTSRNFIQNDPQVNANVYVIAMSNIPATGLKDGVASFPSYFYPVPTLQTFPGGTTNVDLIMESIYVNTIRPPCEPRADGRWLSQIPPEAAGAPGLSYPVVGEVFLIDQATGTRLRTEIRADGPEGRTAYTFTGLRRGTYTLEPYLFYRHPLDPPGFGARRYSLIEYAGETVPTLSVSIPTGNAIGGVTRQDLKLKLFGSTCAAQ